jgi:hypothetical protein
MHYVYVNIDRIKSMGSAVLTVRALRTGQLRHRGSTPSMGKGFLSSPQHPERLCRSPLQHEGKAAKT